MIPPCPRCGKDDFKKTRDRAIYLKRKNPCRKRNRSQKITPKVQASEPQMQASPPQPEALPALIHEPELQMQAPAPEAIGRKEFISQEEADRWVNPNERKPGEHFRTWGTRLLKRWKDLDLGEKDRPKNLRECGLLCHDLENMILKQPD